MARNAVLERQVTDYTEAAERIPSPDSGYAHLANDPVKSPANRVARRIDIAPGSRTRDTDIDSATLPLNVSGCSSAFRTASPHVNCTPNMEKEMEIDVEFGDEEQVDEIDQEAPQDPDEFLAQNSFRIVYQTNNFFLPQISRHDRKAGSNKPAPGIPKTPTLDKRPEI